MAAANRARGRRSPWPLPCQAYVPHRLHMARPPAPTRGVQRAVKVGHGVIIHQPYWVRFGRGASSSTTYELPPPRAKCRRTMRLSMIAIIPSPTAIIANGRRSRPGRAAAMPPSSKGSSKAFSLLRIAAVPTIAARARLRPPPASTRSIAARASAAPRSSCTPAAQYRGVNASGVTTTSRPAANRAAGPKSRRAARRTVKAATAPCSSSRVQVQGSGERPNRGRPRSQ